jgi:hypothetical protein
MLMSTLDELPYKWYKIEEAREDTCTWKELRKHVIKDFSFFLVEANLKEVV